MESAEEIVVVPTFPGVNVYDMFHLFLAGLKELLSELKTEKNDNKDKKVAVPPKETVTHEIHGIEVVDLEDAAASLWEKEIYAETGMGCTGPVILVNESKAAFAREVLKEKGYIA